MNTPRFWSLPVPVLKFPLVITLAAVAFCTISMPAPNAVSANGSYDTWRNSHSADTAGQQRRQMICGCAFHVCPQIVFGIVEQTCSLYFPFGRRYWISSTWWVRRGRVSRILDAGLRGLR